MPPTIVPTVVPIRVADAAISAPARDHDFENPSVAAAPSLMALLNESIRPVIVATSSTMLAIACPIKRKQLAAPMVGVASCWVIHLTQAKGYLQQCDRGRLWLVDEICLHETGSASVLTFEDSDFMCLESDFKKCGFRPLGTC